MNFFHSQNASRPYKAGGYQFVFEPYTFFAGVHKGALMTNVEAEIAALRTLADSGVTEIDQATYEAKTKKKVSLTPSAPASPPSAPLLKASIKSPAEVVEDPQSSNPIVIPTGTAKSIDDILMEGTVMPAQPPPPSFVPNVSPTQSQVFTPVAQGKKKGRPRKNMV